MRSSVAVCSRLYWLLPSRVEISWLTCKACYRLLHLLQVQSNWRSFAGAFTLPLDAANKVSARPRNRQFCPIWGKMNRHVTLQSKITGVADLEAVRK